MSNHDMLYREAGVMTAIRNEPGALRNRVPELADCFADFSGKERNKEGGLVYLLTPNHDTGSRALHALAKGLLFDGSKVLVTTFNLYAQACRAYASEYPDTDSEIYRIARTGYYDYLLFSDLLEPHGDEPAARTGFDRLADHLYMGGNIATYGAVPSSSALVGLPPRLNAVLEGGVWTFTAALQVKR